MTVTASAAAARLAPQNRFLVNVCPPLQIERAKDITDIRGAQARRRAAEATVVGFAWAWLFDDNPRHPPGRSHLLWHRCKTSC